MSWLNVKRELIGMAGAFGADLNDMTLSWYMAQFKAYDPEVVLSALRQYGSGTKFAKLPTPQQVLSLINPEVSEDGQAVEAAARIISAVAKYGYTGSESAKEYIGGLGWKVVELVGWVEICRTLGVSVTPTSAQIKFQELAKNFLTKAKSGRLDEKPALPMVKRKFKELE